MVLIGMVAIVVDISWFWSNSLKVQRAADAAALAGSIHLPGSPGTAFSTARAEAAKNGYGNSGGTNDHADPGRRNPRRLIVTISTPVNTFFAQIFGWRSDGQRNRTRRVQLPVPMGSPQSYLGIHNLTYMDNGSWRTDDVNKAPGASGPAASSIRRASGAP